jgi:hypothetical protein
MRITAVTAAWLMTLCGGCFGEAPHVGTGATATETDGNDTSASTNGTTRVDDGSSASGLDEEGDATASGEATSSTTVTTSSETTTASSETTTEATDTTHDAGSTDSGETTTQDTCVHTVFVTSGVSTAELGGLDGADARCMEAAESLGGDWVAVLSTAAVSAKSRIAVAGTVCNLDGIPIVHDADQWWTGAHLEPINLTEDYVTLDTSWRVWTGTDVNGEATGGDCGGWSLGGQTAGVTVGSAQATNAEWVQATPGNIQQCGFFGRLYCFRQSP